MPEYVWIYNNRQVSEHVRVVNITHTVHTACSLYKWMSIKRWAYSEPWERSKIKFGKIIKTVNYFCKTFHLQRLSCFQYVGFELCQGSEHSWIVNMTVFWLCMPCICWKVLNIFEYARFLQMRGLHKILNIPEYGWIIPE